MIKVTSIAAAVLAVACSPAVFAADLLVTQADASNKSGRVSVSLDIASSGEVSGFQFILRGEGEMKPGSVDTSKCLADLPKGFSGGCRQNADGIYFFALASSKATLPSGIVSLGTLSLPAELAKTQFVVDQLEMINAEAEVISSSNQVVR
ncbi:MAG: hypothetical protein MEQ07_05900 [Aquimonas sp.]|nr:hypothetical protein [Aquimonas sp.]